MARSRKSSSIGTDAGASEYRALRILLLGFGREDVIPILRDLAIRVFALSRGTRHHWMSWKKHSPHPGDRPDGNSDLSTDGKDPSSSVSRTH